MKKIIILSLFLFNILIANANTFTGKILQDNKPLTNVKLIIPSLNLETTTDSTGSFQFKNIEYNSLMLDIEASNHVHYNTEVNFNQEETITIDLASVSLEEIVVVANPLEHNLLKMTTPVAVLSEEELLMDRSLSIEQSLTAVTGINSGSFGAGAGQVVIRGQQGPRVSVLNNNIALKDASSISPDHWISSESLLAKRIEVLKGPATLLYGGGAIGGVVNVIDNAIPAEQIDGIQGAVEFRVSDSTLNERAGVISLEAGITDKIMTHFSYFDSQTDDFKITDSAESEILHESEEHDEHDDEEEEEESHGILENSSVNSSGATIGLSVINDNGYWGLSYADYNRNYGIPGHEHEEEHHDDDDDDDHDGEHEHEGEEVVRIDLDKSIFNIKGQHRFDNSSFIKQLKAHYSQTDYQHIELEGSEIGTVFKNNANEMRVELLHDPLVNFTGVLGLQVSSRDFSAIGDEAFIAPSQTDIYSLFIIEERQFETWHGEFGLRYDKQEISTNLFPNLNDNALSLSFGATFDLDENWIVPINFSAAQRLPTVEELLSNKAGLDELIPHLATNTIEVGNPDLLHETANNLDIGLRYRNENFKFNLAWFYNHIDDYIYLKNSGETFEEVAVFNYSQQQAVFKGFEVDLSYQYLDSLSNQWNFRLFADKTTAKLKNGSYVPRIPASRLGFNVGLVRGPLAVDLDYTHANEQNRIADFELPTKSYNLLDFSTNWLFVMKDKEITTFLKIKNILNSEIREHASFIKDIAPRPARSITAGIRLNF